MKLFEKPKLSKEDLAQEAVFMFLFALVGVFLGWFAGYIFGVESLLLRVIGALLGLGYCRYMFNRIGSIKFGS